MAPIVLTSYLYPALGQALAAADITIPLAIAIILLTAILRGSSQTCERVFRCFAGSPTAPNHPCQAAARV